MPRVFLSQSALDRWLSSSKVELGGDRLSVPAATCVFALEPSVVFLSVDGGGADSQNVLGQARTAGQLDAMGAEHYDTSVIVGETAYTVAPGFLGAPADPMGGELDADGWRAMLAGLEGLG